MEDSPTADGPFDGAADAPSDEHIYQTIFSAVVEHRLLPGTKLKEEALCDVFGVGRTRIRNILTRLTQDRIVSRPPHRSAFVAHPDVNEARAVFSARRLIECHLVRDVAENMTAKGRKILTRHLKAEEKSRAAGDTAATIRICGGFHLVMAQLSDNMILAEIMEELVSRAALIIAIYQKDSDTRCELEEHRRLIKAVTSGKADAAARIMEDHLRGIEARLDLTPPNEPVADLARIFAVS